MTSSNQFETVLVTGANGFVGSHIIVKLLRDTNYKVRGTVRDSTSLKAHNVRLIAEGLGAAASARLELVSAELLDVDTWPSAVRGCAYVIHVASPVSIGGVSEEEVVKPAVQGTSNVLNACLRERGVKRVVLTSSLIAINGGALVDSSNVYTEADWTEVEGQGHVYAKSKTMAERLAWDFIAVHPVTEQRYFDLVVLNPGTVLGPTLTRALPMTLRLVEGMMSGRFLALPNVQVSLIDVRDVAEAHVKVLTLDGVADSRFLLYTEKMWLLEVAETLSAEFSSQGYRVSTWRLPSAVVRCAGWLSRLVRYTVVPFLDKEVTCDNSRMRDVLALPPCVDVRQTVIDTAYSLIEHGLVDRTSGYRGPTGSTSCSSH